MSRSGLSKKLRFDVLERDNFTCQYCGAKSAEVTLHVDHIIPVADGGQTTYENLITSCEACNSGKGSRRLKKRAPLDLTPAAEAAEVRAAEIARWRKAFAEERRLLSEAIESLRSSYNITIPNAVIARAIDKHGLDEVKYALAITSDKDIPRTEFERQTAYFSKVLLNRHDQGQAVQRCPFGLEAKCPEEGCSHYDAQGRLMACAALIAAAPEGAPDHFFRIMAVLRDDLRRPTEHTPYTLCIDFGVYLNNAFRELCGRFPRRDDVE